MRKRTRKSNSEFQRILNLRNKIEEFACSVVLFASHTIVYLFNDSDKKKWIRFVSRKLNRFRKETQLNTRNSQYKNIKASSGQGKYRESD